MIFPSKFATIALAGLLCLSLTACREAEPVRIGFLGGLTGRAAGLGASGRNGFLLAVEQANRAGGVQGRQIDPLVRDDHMDAREATTALRELFESQAIAIVGPMTSQVAIAVVPEADRARVPLVSPTVSTNQLSGHDDYFLRVYYSNAQAAGMLADYLAGKRQRPRLSAIYDLSNRAYTEDWLNNFRQRYEQLGGQLIDPVAFDSAKGAPFSDLADQLLAKNPQGILLLANAVDTAMIAQQLAKRGTSLPLYATGWSYADDLLQMGGKSVEGLTIIQSADQESPSPEYLEFARLYTERFREPPNFPALHAYTATRLLVTAMAKTGADGARIKDALLALPPTTTAQGVVAFDRFGDLRDPEPHLAVISNGTYRSLH